VAGTASTTALNAAGQRELFDRYRDIDGALRAMP
jgi:hypothetical protein